METAMLPVWAILLIPLFSAFVIALFLQRFDRAAAAVGIGSISLCLLLTLSLPSWTVSTPSDPRTEAARTLAGRGRVQDAEGRSHTYLYRTEDLAGIFGQGSWVTWAEVPAAMAPDGQAVPVGAPPGRERSGVKLQLGVWVDNLTYAMLLVVCIVGLLVHIFSIGYLADEGAWGRYFAGLSLFCFSMLGIVVSPNYFQTFIFWELVGVSSYILIGHYYQEDVPPEAAKKAFMTNRVADFLFMIGILYLYFEAGTVEFSQLEVARSQLESNPMFTTIGILLFVGCMGKSAQFPFHIWLPDAMAGPTPVSALMHAATMVAAGVYLVLRSFPIYSDGALQFIAWVGGITALLAALIALVQRDIKKVLAYSTLSQLGYMMLALGMAGFAHHAYEHVTAAGMNVNAADFMLKFKSMCYTAGMFHLTTHAFFKALLFLAAGAVIVGMHHHQDMFEMGGLVRKMPITAFCYLIGALALAGIIPFAGFWSKDLIVHLAREGNPILAGIATFAAGLTALYMTRAWFLTFMGDPRSKHADHAHEVVPSMYIPLLILAVLSIVSGMALHMGIPGIHSLNPDFHATVGEFLFYKMAWHEPVSLPVAIISTCVALIGIGLGTVIYGLGIISPDGIKEACEPVYVLLENKFYCDEIALFLVQKVQDTAAKVLDLIEQQIVIGLGVYGVASLFRRAGGLLRFYQTGSVRDYAALLLAGTLAVLYLVTYTSGSIIGG